MDLYHTFSGCSKLPTIYADVSWTLPKRGLTGTQCFYTCKKLVGGNRTAWASSKTAYTYMKIGKARQMGYLTCKLKRQRELRQPIGPVTRHH